MVFCELNYLPEFLSNEKHTRKQIIDLRLKQAGWNVSDRTQVMEEFDIIVYDSKVEEPTTPYSGHQFSDYVLLGRSGKPLAVIEAKKTSVDAETGREQAKQYCYNIQKDKGTELPFCFYTNGHDIYFWDLEHYPPRKIFGFPTKEDLERWTLSRRHKKKLATELINPEIAGRDYQLKAIRSVMEGIEQKKRKFLLVMATGTGKTRTCIGLVDVLMRAGWAERTLFLVDRIALREQTIDAFKDHLPDEPYWPQSGEKEFKKDRRVYVSTYPSLLNIIRDETTNISPHFFDLIIVDESHRSIYNTYQEILQYFNAITVGLTATPTDIIDHNTFEIFDCEDSLPSFAFTYDEAVSHIPPYLCNFQVMKLKTKFQEEGINKRTITLDDQKKLILEGKEIEEINYEGSDLEKKVINRGTNSLLAKEVMEECIKDSNGVLPGKTIFFCISKAHARRIEEIFNALYPQFAGELAKVIVSEDPRVYGPTGLLQQFKKNDMPRIAISVDMLDTGIDIHEITNLVFAKPVFSYTKFWQMIGRGTRLLDKEKLKPWCTAKDDFLIIDCWDNFEYFKLTPKGKELKPQLPLPVKLFGLRTDKLEKAIERGENEIAANEIAELSKLINLLPRQSVVVLDAAGDLQKVSDDNFWISITAEKTEYLRHFIKPLMRSISGVDFKAMRFEKDVVETSMALLEQHTQQFDILKDALIEQISELPLSISLVAKETELIKESQTANYWIKVTDNDLNHLAERLGPLMKFREGGIETDKPAFLNLKDFLFSKESVDFGPQHGSMSVARYREMLESKIHELEDKNPLLQKIKKGELLTDEETAELAEILHQEYPPVTEELLKQVYQNRRAKFIELLKHIMGLQLLPSFEEEVSASFDNYLKQHTHFTTRQIEFMEVLRTYILEKGRLDKQDLVQSPFTRLHPEGILGVFSTEEIKEILTITEALVA